MMQLARIIHNPTAGEGDHTPGQLLADVKEAGFQCDYFSSKQDILKVRDPASDFLIVAGGDGTVRKVVLEMLENKLKHKMPLALLPLGTANNIARTLGIKGRPGQIIRSWKKKKIQNYDIGRATGLDDDAYFLEAFGYGIFPKLIRKMHKRTPEEDETPEAEMEAAKEMLLSIVDEYEAVDALVETERKTFHDKYLMIELLNIRSIGSNLEMAPDADPGDGIFELVLVPESKRKVLKKYIRQLFEGTEAVFPVKPVKTRMARIFWQGKDVHADDTLLKEYVPVEVELKVMHSFIEFLVPEQKTGKA